MTEVDQQQDKRQELVWKVFLWGLGILVSIALAGLMTLFSEVEEIHDDLISIQSSRCTSRDCGDLRVAISTLEAELAQIPTEIPPKWFLDKVNTVERKLEILERRIWQNGSGEEPSIGR